MICTTFQPITTFGSVSAEIRYDRLDYFVPKIIEIVGNFQLSLVGAENSDSEILQDVKQLVLNGNFPPVGPDFAYRVNLLNQNAKCSISSITDTTIVCDLDQPLLEGPLSFTITHPQCSTNNTIYTVARVVKESQIQSVTINNNAVGVAVGVSIAGVAVLIAAIVAGVFYYRMKHPPAFLAQVEGEVNLVKRLGNGNFGEVWLGTWIGAQVAAKRCKDLKYSKDFDREALTLQYFFFIVFHT
jgi:hypothetical protein